MKSLFAALVAAFFMSGCQTAQPDPSTLPDCEARMNELGQEQVGKLHREVAVASQVAVATFVYVFQDAVTNRMYGIMIALPGSLVPANESPFVYTESCRTEQGVGRIYQAEFTDRPHL